MADPDLVRFVAESNRIEGITRRPLKAEIEAHERLLDYPGLAIADLPPFVHAVQPGAVLRDRKGLNVRVGDHVPIPGGEAVVYNLKSILIYANGPADPWRVHCNYETLHPFTDGNGRSGRALWLWMMLRQARDPWALRRGFLHTFYYQTLGNHHP